MAKFKLEPVHEYPYVLVGINTGLPNHKLCWKINRLSGLEMERTADVEVRSKSGDSTFHALYVHEDPDDGSRFRMVQNKAFGGLFLPECKEADAVLVIDESMHLPEENLLKTLREIPGVILTFSVDTEKLKNKQNLLLIA